MSAISNQEREAIFFSALYYLKDYCQSSLSDIQKILDERNIQLLKIFHANSYKLTPDIQQKVQETMIIQKKSDIFKTIQDSALSLISRPDKFSRFPKEEANTFETILWLLRKFKTQQYLSNFREAIITAYGQDTLSNFEQFSHVDLELLEKKFEGTITQSTIATYLSEIEKTYFPKQPMNPNPTPGADKKNLYPSLDPVNFQPYKPNPIPNFQYQQQPQQMFSQNQQPAINPPKNLPNNNYTPINWKPNPTIKPNLTELFNQARNLPVQPDPALNQSNAFNFKKRNLQISTLKGLTVDNIEFYDQIEPALRQAGELFTDETFPPMLSSLTSDVEAFPIAKKVVWKRISEIYKGKPVVLCSDQISPSDIKQGSLGDCYFLSALSVLSEKRDFIKRLFHSKEVSSTGCYSVWLCSSGEWKNMIIDDFVPCIDNGYGPKPCFSNSKSNDIWVLLLEKAFAKLYGSYFAIDGGFQAEALSSLTGAPTKYFQQKENGIHPLDQMWLFLTGNLQNKFIVTAATRSKSQIFNHEQLGIVSDHAYAILDAQEVQLPNGQREKLIKIRNPWGLYEWKGDWGDNSKKWTPELKKQLKFEGQKDDGIFWMSLIDFDTHFETVCSCEVHDDYFFSFLKLGAGDAQKRNIFLAKLSNPEDGFVYLTVQQKQKKFFKEKYGYNYSFLRLFVAKIGQSGEFEFPVYGKYKKAESTVIKKHLPKGNYIVFIEVDWVQKFHNEICLMSYSKTSLEMIEKPIFPDQCLMLYKHLVKTYITKSGDSKITRKQYDLDGSKIQVTKNQLKKFGLVIAYFSNKETDIAVHLKLENIKLKQMEFMEPKLNGSTIEIAIPAQQDRFVIIKARIFDEGTTSYVYEYSEAYKMVNCYSVEKLKDLCKQKGIRTEKLDIVCYEFKYLGGFADYYVSKRKSGVLQEEITFDNQNLLVNGQALNRLEIFVAPGEDYLIDVRVQNVFQQHFCKRKTKSMILA